MGFFSFLSGPKYTQQERELHAISTEELEKRIVLKEHNSLTITEKRLLIAALLKESGSDRKISFAQADALFRRLEKNNSISENDRRAMQEILRDYFFGSK